jgi:hypothetical protein
MPKVQVCGSLTEGGGDEARYGRTKSMRAKGNTRTQREEKEDLKKRGGGWDVILSIRFQCEVDSRPNTHF